MAAGGGAIPFLKMVAAGNAFVLVDGRDRPDRDWAALAIATGDRRLGVGHDGLLVVLESARADVRQRMFNPDGTEDMCGNGLRCTARYALQAGLAGHRMTIETVAGVRRAEDWGGEGDGRDPRAEIGRPRIVPMAGSVGEGILSTAGVVNVEGRVMLVDMGTPHFVIPSLGPQEDEVWRQVSARLEVEAVAGRRVTVTWYERARGEPAGAFRARFWERSVGETGSCGTGAAAILASARALALAGRSARIVSRGGTLVADVGEDGSIFVAGPVRTVFRGEWPVPGERPAQGCG